VSATPLVHLDPRDCKQKAKPDSYYNLPCGFRIYTSEEARARHLDRSEHFFDRYHARRVAACKNAFVIDESILTSHPSEATCPGCILNEVAWLDRRR
jgi:hypothetical protein